MNNIHIFYWSESKWSLYCAECAEHIRKEGAHIKEETCSFADIYDGEEGGLHCADCTELL